jgi:radical SAM superfamily enzyme YgiQ (UPF0313 family)
MASRILLVNPPIYDFSAYDFWLKPYGLLRVAGMLRDQADLHLFDYLDRFGSLHPIQGTPRSDSWGTGKFHSRLIPKPSIFDSIPRRYRRYGIPRDYLEGFLTKGESFDFALIQTGMTYWYLGVKEVIEDLRRISPQTKVVLGGVYATLSPGHAESLGADLVVKGSHLEPLWKFLKIRPNLEGLPFWEAYPNLHVGVLKLADGCPFRCTYCSVPKVDPNFVPRPLERAHAELDLLCNLGVENIAFYDDALLFRAESLLVPFLRGVLEHNLPIHFHTPNALNARFITENLARLMVQAGFRTFYLGFESKAYQWQRRTGGKVYSDEFVRAVENLAKAGADPNFITAYLIIGHPHGDHQEVEASMKFVHGLGIRVMLSEFSPIPNTPDGDACGEWIDLSEPLWSNKTVFPILSLGAPEVDRVKDLCLRLNEKQKTGTDLKMPEAFTVNHPG